MIFQQYCEHGINLVKKVFGMKKGVFISLSVLIALSSFFFSCSNDNENSGGKSNAHEKQSTSKIAFESTRGGTYDIWIMDADGSNPVKLTDGRGWNRFPAWSSDGKSISFVSSREKMNNFKLYVINADGSGLRKVTDAISKVGFSTWSPDSRKIAFATTVCCRGKDSNIFIIDADSTLKEDSVPRNLTNTKELNSEPDWSHDGTKIAFVTTTVINEKDKVKDIFVINVDGTNPVKLTDSLTNDESPCWSPDGTKIAYDSVIDGVADICVMNADGSGKVNLTQDNFKDFEPVWSPDGKEIAFATVRGGNREIYVMNADGTNHRSVSNHDMLDDFPSWSPELTK